MLESESKKANKNEHKSEETKNAILDAAIEVFYKKGVTKASLEEIAKRANVTRGAIYWHFKDKKEIFKSLHESLYKNVMQTIAEGLDKNVPNPLSHLQNIAIECLLDLAQNKKRQKILTIFICKCDYSGMEDILLIQKEKKQKNIEYCTKYFEQAKTKGFLTVDVLTENAAIGFSCYMSGIISEFLRNKNFDLEKKASDLIKCFFQNLERTK